MAYENLDFSGWKAGNSALAKSNVDSTTTKAKAKAAQTTGLTAGIGTVLGAVFGGPMGAAIGRSIGGGDMSGIADAITSDLDTSWEDTFSRSSSKNKKDAFKEGQTGDLMQLASSYNMIDESGNVKPTFLELIKNIGA